MRGKVRERATGTDAEHVQENQNKLEHDAPCNTGV